MSTRLPGNPTAQELMLAEDAYDAGRDLGVEVFEDNKISVVEMAQIRDAYDDPRFKDHQKNFFQGMMEEVGMIPSLINAVGAATGIHDKKRALEYWYV